MKGVVFTTDEKMYVKDFSDPLYQTVGKVVGGWIEIVHPKHLPEPLCMIVDDEGLLKIILSTSSAPSCMTPQPTVLRLLVTSLLWQKGSGAENVTLSV